MNSVHRISRPLTFHQANVIAYRALSKEASVSALAREHNTSRQTVRKERNRVQLIVDQTEHKEEILFYLPVTLKWLQQLVIALVFIMNGSYRNISQLIKELFDYSFHSDRIADVMKSVYNTVNVIDQTEDLSSIKVASQDAPLTI